MLFMNEAEIDYAAQRVAQVRDAGSREVLLKAVKLLQDLKDLANSVSDGWAYWPKPCKAARQLHDW